MPNRVLREGILDSDRIDRLDWPEEVFYRRLMSKVDDHGLFDARPAMLRTALYPLRVDRVREADITRWIAACEKAGVIALYEHGGKPYGQMLDTKWQTRSEPKFPTPPWGKCPQLRTDVHGPPATASGLQATANSCAQLQTSAHLDGDGDGVVVGVEDEGVVERMERARAAPKKPPRGTRIPDGFPGEADVAWCRAERPSLDPEGLAEKFRDYWLGVPGQRGSKADWPATWRNFVRSEWSRSPPGKGASSRQDRIATTVAGLTGRTREPETIDVVATERVFAR